MTRYSLDSVRVDFLHEHIESFLEKTFACAYWKDCHGRYLGVNDVFLQASGVGSPLDIIGKTDRDLIWHEQAQALMTNDKIIITTENAQVWLEQAQHTDGYIANYLSHKSPLRNRRGKVIGVFGLSYVFEEDDWSVDKLTEINMIVGGGALDRIKRYLSTLQRNKHQLTRRQLDCLFYLVQGMTAKQIAEMLALSRRTVEQHLDSIRAKLGCQLRSELIARALDLGL